MNKDHPQCNVPRKAIKACPGKGCNRPSLSLTERPRRISVARVNLSHLIHNATDTTGQCPHHLLPPHIDEKVMAQKGKQLARGHKVSGRAGKQE